MHERHELEQYFWDDATAAELARFARPFERVCCLCAPLAARELARLGGSPTLLDAGERLADWPGYRRWDLYRPERLPERFDLILCDPPFFRVSLAQLFSAVRTLAHFDFAQPLLLCYLTRRSANVLGAFAPFGLEATGYFPRYRTVQALSRNEVQFYGNLGEAKHAGLRALAGQ